jgi:hypothetical protein
MFAKVPNTYKALEPTTAQPVSIHSKEKIGKNNLKRLAAKLMKIETR